jgi:non-ribosomal peptide synthetase component F
MAAVRMHGPLDLAALARSAREIVRRHEALRTSFRVQRGVPVQVVEPLSGTLLRLVDLAGLPSAARDAEVRRLAGAEVRRPFDLSTGPLLRLTVARLEEEDHVLVLTIHHIVSDGWSLGVFVSELAALYRAFAAGRPSPLPELPIQYRDFALWQREWLSGEVLDAQLGYWRHRLAGAPPLLRLPVDRPRPPVQGTRGATRAWRLPAAAAHSLRALCRAEGATLFMGLLAAFKALLRAVCGQDDVVVGTDVANRGRREVEGLIGFFVNSLVLRTGLGGDPTFRELLGRVRATTLGAYAHQDLPFSRLVEELRPERSRSHNPFFQAVLVLHNFPLQTQQSSGLTLTPFPVHGGSAKFDMSFYLTESGEELEGLLEYNADLFEDSTIARLLEHFRSMLDAMVADPDRRLSMLSLARPEHTRGAIDDFNEDLEAC